MTTKGRYGLRAMVELARYDQTQEFISLKNLSHGQNIPENYLERLLAKLRKAQLIETHRGTQGGYRLRRRPEEINVLQILQAVGEPISVVDCTEDGSECPMLGHCPGNIVWTEIAQNIENVTENIFLSELK